MTRPAPRVLALIPARAGSRRVPGKNARPLAGQSLLERTVRTARSARCFDRIVVTTEDPTLARLARRSGAEVPFRRPARLATDRASSWAVVRHALDWFAARGETFDAVTLLQPTSPLRAPADLRGAVSLFFDRRAAAVVGVAPAAAPPGWLVRVDGRGVVRPLDGSVRGIPRGLWFRYNGAVYVVRPELVRRGRPLPAGRTLAFVMPAERSLDVDTPWDWRVAEAILSGRGRRR